MKTTTVPLERIAWRDRRYTFSRGGEQEELEASIRAVGLLDPPDLLREKGRFVIIRGSRRLRVLRRLGRATAAARVYDVGELDPLAAWSMNFHETIALRPLNPAEACAAVRQLLDLGVSRGVIEKRYLRLLDLPGRGRTVDECLGIDGLESAILDTLAEGAITFSTASYLASLAKKDRTAAFRFLKKRPLTVSQQREWTRLVGDIAARESLTPSQVLSSASRAAARRPEKPGTAALQILREKRYPALAERRRAFRALVKKLKLPPWFLVETHPFFERSELTVRFTARDVETWQKALLLLERIGRDPGVRQLMPPRPARKASR